MRFEIGEVAKLIVANGPRSLAHLNEDVEILKKHVYNLKYYTPFDYGTIASDGTRIGCMDWQLQKLDPPKEPSSLVRDETIEEELNA